MVTERSDSDNTWIQFSFCTTCDTAKNLGYKFTEWIKQLHLVSMKTNNEEKGAVPKLERLNCNMCQSTNAIKVTFIW
jgi:hypothetical protein